MHPKLFLLPAVLLLSLSVLAQSPCQPILHQAQAALNSGNTEQALRKLQDVEICDDGNALIRQRQQLQNAIFAKVNEQRLAAIAAQAEAEQERETARQALAELAASQEKIQRTLDRAQKLADAIPFYDGKYAVRQGHVPGVDWHLFALGTPYHFIDKEGVSVDKLGLWRSAELFDEDGYARVVTSGGLELLIDTTGESFSVAYEFSELYRNTDIAYLGKNDIDSIGILAQKAPYLKALFLDRIAIDPTVIPSLMETLMDLESLESLSLSACSLNEFPMELLQLTQLKKLDISRNNITAIPAEIAQLQQLKELNLRGLKLDEFPMGVTELKALEVFHFREKFFLFGYRSARDSVNMPPALFSLPHLVALDFYNDTLTQIPAAIADMSQLRKLTLACTALQKLPENLTQLRLLEELNIFGGNFDAFPSGILQLSRLEELRITNTNLEQLPNEIGQLPALLVLDISENKLQALPESVDLLMQLKELKLFSNRLTHLPPNIGNLRRLTELNLSDNELEAIPASIGNMVNLTKINGRQNSLIDLPPEIGNLGRLSELLLSNNQLTALPSELGQLERLYTLELSNNQLSTLPASIGQLEQLWYLWLASNRIKTVPDEMAQLTKLLRLDLKNNGTPSSTLEKLVEILPDFCTIHPNLEDVYKAEKNYPKLYELQKLRTVDNNSELAYHWIDLSKYSALVGDFYLAVGAAEKAIQLDDSYKDGEIALAFAHILTDQWADAELVFLKWKGKPFWENGPIADISILSKLDELEAAGITHPDFAKVRALFE